MTEHIQINDVQPRIHYMADGVQSAFAFPFAIFKTADLEVWLDEVKQTAGYTVSGAGISTGGTALLAAPPGPGVGVTLRRRLALARTTDYQSDGLIRAKTLNDELDFQVAAVQQVAEELGRAVRRSPTSASTADLTLPEPAPRRGLRWNDDGTALVNTTTDPEATGNAAQAAAQAMAARDEAVAAAGGVKVSATDTSAGPLASKLMAGEGITLTASGSGDERLTITGAATLPPSILDRLAFLETNLAVNTLRDQIDAGWSVLKMTDGWADEFEDQTGVDAGASTNESYDGAGDFFAPAGGGSVVTVREASGAPSPVSYVTTYADRTYALQNDATVDAIGVYSTHVSTALVIKVLRENSSSNYDVVHSQQVTHAGEGWQDFALPSPFAVPATGIYRFAYCPNGQSVTMGGAAGTRAYRDENAAGTNLVFQEDAGALPNFRIGYHAAPADMDLVSSQVLPAQSPPAEARLVLLHEPVDAVTVNADLFAEVSRDGGATWSAAALADEGAFDATTRILSGLADLSAQPTGTAMTWRVRTLNTTSQRLHGVWIQWR